MKLFDFVPMKIKINETYRSFCILGDTPIRWKQYTHVSRQDECKLKYSILLYYLIIIVLLRYIYNLINVLFYVYISAFCWRSIGKGKNSIEGVWKPTPIVQELSPTRVRMQEENLQYK